MGRAVHFSFLNRVIARHNVALADHLHDFKPCVSNWLMTARRATPYASQIDAVSGVGAFMEEFAGGR